MGSDVTKQHDIDFFIYIPTEEGAYKLAAQIQKDGFEVDVHPPGTRPDWLCIAVKNMVPNLDELEEIR